MTPRALLEARLAEVLPADVTWIPANTEAHPEADGRWLVTEDRPGKTWTVNLYRRCLGVFVVTLHLPPGEGPGPAEDLARTLGQGLESRRLRQQGLLVQPGLAQWGPGSVAEGWYRLPLELPYLATELAEAA